MTCGLLSCEITSYVESLFKSSILQDVEMTCGMLSCEITSYVESLFNKMLR
jgi:energy-converting hydrogenase Eha subunit A